MTPKPYEGPPGRTMSLWMPQVDAWINANDRMHWAKKSRLTRSWRNAGLVYARKERLPRFERVEIKVRVHKTTARKYDAMNTYPTWKAVVDGFVDYGLLPDDDNDHLLGPFIIAGPKQSEAGATIEITALEGHNTA